jgi:uncharacterized protein DUF2330
MDRYFFICVMVLLAASTTLADGMMVGPKKYNGVAYEKSPQERSQEAIIIFTAGDGTRPAKEDIILRVRVDGEVDHFAWVIPFPTEPKIAKEDAALFPELYSYVEARRAQLYSKGHKSNGSSKGTAADATPEVKPIEVIARKVVGSYDTAVVRENVAGALNKWLDSEGFQSLGDAEDVLGFYRKKGYVFVCVKVTDAALAKGKAVDLHPLRFTFETGGRDGIYFPMKLTGLQAQPFDVNLYVFHGKWLNDHLNRYGFEHRGFKLRHRDWDTKDCTRDAGKAWSAPGRDPYLKSLAGKLPNATKLFQKLHPGARFYLTNIEARGLKPGDVREWPDDLWLFPYYTNRSFTPFDARKGAAASAAWPDAPDDQQAEAQASGRPGAGMIIAVLLALLAVVLGFTFLIIRRRRRIRAGRAA